MKTRKKVVDIDLENYCESFEGEFDLPLNLCEIIRGWMSKKGWYGSFSPKGTLSRDKISTEDAIDTEFEVAYSKFTIVYYLVRKFMRVKQSQCPHCEEWIDETDNYIAQYYISEIWIGKHEYTDRFKSGGDLTQTAYKNKLEELSLQTAEEESVPTYVS